MLSSIISLYKKVLSEINKSTSGKCKFNLILSFISDCEKVFNTSPPAALTKDFISVLLDVILKSDISFTDPAKLNTAKIILGESRRSFESTKGGEVIAGQINKAIDILNMQMLKSYFYLGKYDDGIIVLKSMLEQREIFFGEKEEGAKREKKNTREIKHEKYALVNPEIYKESKAYEILTEIKNELERLNSYSDTSVNVLLVEHDSKNAGFSGGTIQNLLCDTSKKLLPKEEAIEFDNITDFDDSNLKETLKDIHLAANGLIKFVSGKSASANMKRALRFQNVKGVYKGSSLGLGGAVVSACNYFNYSNSKKRYKISNAAAFTGVVNKDGKVAAVSRESISDKIEAAFFSWVKYCVVPKENYNDAVDTYRNLKSSYPTKEMKIIGIETASDVFNYPELIKTEVLSAYDYSRAVIDRNKVLSYSIFTLLIIIASVYTSIHLIPKEQRPLPTPQSQMSLIYAPDREEKWLFKNSDSFGGDTIDFGDVAVGDQWLPYIELWNNSNNSESFDVKIEGSDDFEILWFEEEKQPASVPENVKPDIMQRLNIKYAPLRPAEKVFAKVIFSLRGDADVSKTIFLKASSNYYEGGYSAVIKDGDDRIVINPGRNLTSKEFTVSFWIKPDSELITNRSNDTYFEDYGFPFLRFSSDNSSINTLIFTLLKDSTLSLRIPNRKADFKNAVSVKAGLKMNEWNYVCASYDLENIYLTINEEVIKKLLDRDIIRQVNDIIIFGNHHPEFDKSRDYDKLSGGLKVYNFKVYEKFINTDQMESFKYNRPKWNDDGIVLNYEFSQMNDKKIYDLSKSDIWGFLNGGVTRSLDIPLPFIKKEPFERTSTGNIALLREEEGRMDFYRNVFKGVKNFSIQMDVKYYDLSERKEEFFTILNPEKEYFLSISKDSLFMYYGKYKITDKVQKNVGYPYVQKWQRYTLTYENGVTNVYVDSNLAVRMEFPESSFNIEKMNYGIIFGNIAYIAAARHYGKKVAFDNIRLYNRPLKQGEIFSEPKEGMLAEWTFDNIQGYYTYDNVMRYPALLKGNIKPVTVDN